jgi:alkylation response protein AidB-like acyl-CoA dehydrogenase
MTTKIFASESAHYRASQNIDDAYHALVAGGLDSSKARLKSLEEFAIECAILKVHGSEVLDFSVDEGVQIYGGMGFSAEGPMDRAYRDARINRIFEGTNEINRLFIPGLLMRRAQRGRFPLVSAITKVSKELLEMSPSDDSGVDELTLARGVLANAKKLVLFISGVAYQKYGEKLAEEQEIAASLSDIIMDVYLAESALLRTLKLRQAGNRSSILSDLTLLFANEAVGRIDLQARQALAASAEGDELRGHLGLVRRSLRWSPLNTVALRRRIAKKLCEVGSFPALVASK